jgi:DNA-directed RNA polymerase
MDSLNQTWRSILTQAIEDRVQRLKKRSELYKDSKNTVFIFPFLEMLPTEDCVQLMLDEFHSISTAFSDSYSPSITMLQRLIGEKVEEMLQIGNLNQDPETLEKYETVMMNYFEWFLNPSNPEFDSWCPREAFAKIESKHFEGPLLSQEPLKWPFTLKLKVGRELFKLVLNNLNVNIGNDGSIIVDDKCLSLNYLGELVTKPKGPNISVNGSSPALYKVYRARSDNTQIEEVKPHPVLSKLFALAKYSSLRFSASELPMLIPPVPWSSSARGGYLLKSADFSRIREEGRYAVELEEIREKSNSAYAVFDSLNQLGN